MIVKTMCPQGKYGYPDEQFIRKRIEYWKRKIGEDIWVRGFDTFRLNSRSEDYTPNIPKGEDVDKYIKKHFSYYNGVVITDIDKELNKGSIDFYEIRTDGWVQIVYKGVNALHDYDGDLMDQYDYIWLFLGKLVGMNLWYDGYVVQPVKILERITMP